MRENIKNVGLILALIIAGVSLPTSIMSFMDKPTHITEINNYYYNTTIIERYNTTIIERYNTTIIERYNTTMEYYHFGVVESQSWFFNITFDITNITILMFVISTNSSSLDDSPWMWAYKDSAYMLDTRPKVDWSRIVTVGIYEFKFVNYLSNDLEVDITIERLEL